MRKTTLGASALLRGLNRRTPQRSVLLRARFARWPKSTATGQAKSSVCSAAAAWPPMAGKPASAAPRAGAAPGINLEKEKAQDYALRSKTRTGVKAARATTWPQFGQDVVRAWSGRGRPAFK